MLAAIIILACIKYIIKNANYLMEAHQSRSIIVSSVNTNNIMCVKHIMQLYTFYYTKKL